MEKPHKYNASAFAFLVPVITEVARKHGYAIGLHGSLHADLDLMAMPWTDDASPAVLLIEEIRECVNGLVLLDGTPGGKWSVSEQAFVPVRIDMPEKKPHGRLAWNINLNGGMRIDISVMPTDPDPGAIARVRAEAVCPKLEGYADDHAAGGSPQSPPVACLRGACEHMKGGV